MSGGVDSSVAAWLLKDAGYEVIGVSLRLISEDSFNKSGRCCSAEDMTDARQVCEKIGIPFYAIDLRDRFKDVVIKPFVKAYAQGKTPNPCLECNHHIKFGNLFNIAKSLGVGLGTGHYAAVCYYKGIKTLKRSKDIKKDQSYNLYGTPSRVLDVLHLPLGNFKKSEVREIATKIGLKVSNKPDSQEICFVSDNYAYVVEKYLGKLPIGDLIYVNGKKLAKHKGIHHYTIGQRRGIGIGIGSKLYVIGINAKNNQITIGPKKALRCKCLWIKNVHQVVSQGEAQLATWRLLKNNQLMIEFKKCASAIALGQSAVVYDDNFLLGGGIISNKD